MTFYQLTCYTKTYNAAMGYIDRRSVTQQEIEVAIEVLKKLADERDDWTDEQKELYKSIADIAKKMFEESQNE